jgi:hypothetical protein
MGHGDFRVKKRLVAYRLGRLGLAEVDNQLPIILLSSCNSDYYGYSACLLTFVIFCCILLWCANSKKGKNKNQEVYILVCPQ